MDKLRLGILGAGAIGATMATTVREMDEVVLYAVAAREYEKARKFSDTYGAQRAYGSYEELAADENVDLIYVATPHSHHYQHAKLCIEYGRPVLCEKAFTENAVEAKALIQFAAEKGVFITEAMWVRYMPMSFKLKEILSQGRIGKIVGLTANLGYSLMHVERMVRPELAGGALLDLGVYTINFATWVLGDEIQEITSSMVPHDTGVDKQEFLNFVYPGGVSAGLFSTMQAVTDRRGVIYGTEGYLEVDNINNFERFRIYDNEYRLQETIERPEQITGYEYELLACRRALAEGKLECPEMPHAHTLYVMELLDRIRREWGN